MKTSRRSRNIGFAGTENGWIFRAVRTFLAFAALLPMLETCSTARADNFTPMPLRDVQGFDGVQAQLQALVNTMGFHSVNHFCIIYYKGRSKNDWMGPFIYWPTQNKFVIWGFGSDTILGSSNYFDIDRDILPDGKYPASTIPTRSDIKNVIDDCRQYGSAYTVVKTSGDWIAVKKIKEFSGIEKQLQYLVDNNATVKTNKFCVVGQKDGAYLAAYVYWKTMAKLIFWEPNPDDANEPFAVTYMPVQINLKTGLESEDTGKNHFDKMQRSYALSVLAACEAVGEQFIVEKSN